MTAITEIIIKIITSQHVAMQCFTLRGECMPHVENSSSWYSSLTSQNPVRSLKETSSNGIEIVLPSLPETVISGV